MRLIHKFMDWDVNHRYIRWVQRLHARWFHTEGSRWEEI